MERYVANYQLSEKMKTILQEYVELLWSEATRLPDITKALPTDEEVDDALAAMQAELDKEAKRRGKHSPQLKDLPRAAQVALVQEIMGQFEEAGYHKKDVQGGENSTSP
ncbi:MAG: hypothetical protein ACE5H6_01555 [Dehalococcoidia bacterium]